jgi:tetratricopeptide (TPR) repeat protein
VRVTALVIAVALACGAARVSAATDARELKAREDFAAGRFQEALDIFARLYAESLHPNYLRNIARCYQKLGQPDRAIDSFRDYLQKAKDVTPDEKNEIEGYIKEMQDLKHEQAAAKPGPAPAPASLPVAPEPTSPAATGTAAVVINNPAAEPAPAEKPIYAKWWFWTLIGGAAVAAGVGIAAATGVFTKTQNAPCNPPTMCPQ